MDYQLSYLLSNRGDYSSVSLSFIGTSSRYGGRMVKLQRSLWAGGRASPRAPAAGASHHYTGPSQAVRAVQPEYLILACWVSTCCCLSCFVEENLNLS